MKDEDGSYTLGLFIGIIAGTMGAYVGFSEMPSLVCPAQVPSGENSTQRQQSYYPSSHGDPRNLKTYLYKCGIWESDTIAFSGGNPTTIDRDVFDLMINGTEPLATSIYGYTLGYQPFR
ncbi:hypothetical protein GGR51DRAFT_560592 [Nemania sp. FL0031]|nr:hypothetical protein GGR51DRAFT_560592 [Nemania sp. FL0031]